MSLSVFFFFQAEDGIRDYKVTGVQTCALPIWGAMKLLRRSAAFERGVQACLQSWKEGGSEIDVMELLPDLARECGLRVETFRTHARVGAVGSLEWRWIEEFF